MTKKIPTELTIVATRIAEYRQKHGLTYQEIGDATGVDKSHIYRIENMATFPSLQFLIRLAEFMEVPLYYLFLPSEQMNHQALIDALTNYCKDTGKSYDELEAETGISAFRLQDIEDGTTTPNYDERQQLLTLLGLQDAAESVPMKLGFLKTILGDLQLKEQQIEKLLTYVQQEIG